MIYLNYSLYFTICYFSLIDDVNIFFSVMFTHLYLSLILYIILEQTFNFCIVCMYCRRPPANIVLHESNIFFGFVSYFWFTAYDIFWNSTRTYIVYTVHIDPRWSPTFLWICPDPFLLMTCDEITSGNFDTTQDGRARPWRIQSPRRRLSSCWLSPELTPAFLMLND